MCYLDGRLYYATAEGASTALFRLNYRNSSHKVLKLAIYEAPIWLFHNATLSACQQWLYTTGARDVRVALNAIVLCPSELMLG